MRPAKIGSQVPWIALTALIGGACNGGSSGSPAETTCDFDAASCSGALDAAGSCSLTMPLTGALSGTATGDSRSCGQGLNTIYFVTNLGIVSLHFSRWICSAETGKAPLDAISLGTGEEAGLKSWTTPQSGCTIFIDSNVCGTVTDVGYLISGHGHCDQSAQPDPGNASTAVSIGDFSFTFFERTSS